MDAVTTNFLNGFAKMVKASEGKSLEEARAMSKAFFSVPKSSFETVARFENVLVPDQEYAIPVRVFIPEGKGPFPLMIHFHGGGWVFGGIDQNENFCRRMANRAKAVVATVEYRLAPENPFPKGVEDCYKATQWLIEHAKQFSADAHRVCVAGESAGGTLAAAVALMARDRKGPKIALQLLLYPVTTSSLDKKVYDESPDQSFVTFAGMNKYWQMYVQNPKELKNSYASPLDCSDLSNLPPAYIVAAEFDPLCVEAIAYAKKLKSFGVSVESKVYPRTIHSFMNMPVDLKYTEQAIQEAAARVRAL